MSAKQGSSCKGCVKLASPLAPVPGLLPRIGRAFQLLCIHRVPGRVSLENCLGSAKQASCFRFSPGCSKQASVALQRAREVGMQRSVVPLHYVGVSQHVHVNILRRIGWVHVKDATFVDRMLAHGQGREDEKVSITLCRLKPFAL